MIEGNDQIVIIDDDATNDAYVYKTDPHSRLFVKKSAVQSLDTTELAVTLIHEESHLAANTVDIFYTGDRDFAYPVTDEEMHLALENTRNAGLWIAQNLSDEELLNTRLHDNGRNYRAIKQYLESTVSPGQTAPISEIIVRNADSFAYLAVAYAGPNMLKKHRSCT